MQKRDMHKLSFHLRVRAAFFVYCEIFGEFLNIHLSFFASLLVNLTMLHFPLMKKKKFLPVLLWKKSLNFGKDSRDS